MTANPLTATIGPDAERITITPARSNQGTTPMAKVAQPTTSPANPAPPALSPPGLLRRCVAAVAPHVLPLIAAAGWVFMITAMLPAFAGAGPARDHLGGAHLPVICKATPNEGNAK